MRALVPAICLLTVALAAMPTASVYHHSFAGKVTASGEVYNPKAFTAANRTLPFGTCVAISRGRHTVRVRINDRGPWILGRQFDLSEAAAKRLGITGVSAVSFRLVAKYKCGALTQVK